MGLVTGVWQVYCADGIGHWCVAGFLRGWDWLSQSLLFSINEMYVDIMLGFIVFFKTEMFTANGQHSSGLVFLMSLWREVWLGKYFGGGPCCRPVWLPYMLFVPTRHLEWNCHVIALPIGAENKPSRPPPPAAEANPQSPTLPLPSDDNRSLGNAPHQSKPPRPKLPGPGAPGSANGSAPKRPMSLHSQGTSADSSACEGACSHWPRE
jgi:hypothetical protein